MGKQKHGNTDSTELRRRAIQVVNARVPTPPAPPPTSVRQYRQELDIHRVELELQNEELRAARAELEAGLDRYTQLFDFAPIGYATLDTHGTVREMNHAGAGLLYERRSRLIGRHFGQFIAPTERPSFEELLHYVTKSDRKETRDFELICIGEERPSVRVTVASLAGAEPTILIAFEDITAQRRAEERILRADVALREADRRKDEFLAVLSHELRTPLSTLLMYGQLLRVGDLDDAGTRAAAEAIERAARLQARLIDDLLDVSRIVTGKLSMQVEEVNLAAVTRAALDVIHKEAGRRKIALTADLGRDIRTIMGDAARLQQVITNLLTNALKFTPAGGEIRVMIQLIDQRVRIQVEDTGSGIDPEFLPQIFERFSQADRTKVRGTGGLGLGLSIARSIVEAHQGSIRATSKGRGKGAKFVISLPVGAPAPLTALSQAAFPGPVATSRIKGRRLLVVEDDDSTRETLTEVLALAGADVRAAAGAAAAMRVLSKFCPDVLVCDISMPGEDGCALLRRIRARSPKKSGNVRALALTAFASDDDRERTRAAGFEAHLVKPVDIDQLLAAVSNLLPHKDTNALVAN